jgi:hypothetical protein
MKRASRIKYPGQHLQTRPGYNTGGGDVSRVLPRPTQTRAPSLMVAAPREGSASVALGSPAPGRSRIDQPLERPRQRRDTTSAEPYILELTGSPPYQANHPRRDPPRPVPRAAQAAGTVAPKCKADRHRLDTVWPGCKRFWRGAPVDRARPEPTWPGLFVNGWRGAGRCCRSITSDRVITRTEDRAL